MHHQDPVGEAALEFISALVSGRVSLRKDHLNELIATIKNDSVLNQVFEFISSLKQKRFG